MVCLFPAIEQRRYLRRLDQRPEKTFFLASGWSGPFNKSYLPVALKIYAPDREFDRFHAQVIKRVAEGKDPASVFNLSRYATGSEPYLNVFRYFAKLLCCHVAESCGPRAIAMSNFAIGRADWNPVFLHIDTDPTYAAYSTTFGEHQFAAHGGLIVPVDSKTDLPTGFRSSLSLGAVRYIFWVRYGPMIGLALRMFHRNFWSRCEAAYREALENPLSDEERHRLGI